MLCKAFKDCKGILLLVIRQKRAEGSYGALATLFDEFSKYMSNLKKDIDVVLIKDVAPVVVDRIEAASEENVYQAYERTLYEPRGSLKEDSSYNSSASGQILTITANVMSNPDQPGYGPYVPIEISGIIEAGEYYGPRWSSSQIFKKQPYPRPWMQPGLDNSISDRSAENALENGLIGLGY